MGGVRNLATRKLTEFGTASCHGCRDVPGIVGHVVAQLETLAGQQASRTDARELIAVATRVCGGCRNELAIPDEAFRLLAKLREARTHLETFPGEIMGSKGKPSGCPQCSNLRPVAEEIALQMPTTLQRMKAKTGNTLEQNVIVDLTVAEAIHGIAMCYSCPRSQALRTFLDARTTDYLKRLMAPEEKRGAPAREVVGRQKTFGFTSAEMIQDLLRDPIYREVSNELMSLAGIRPSQIDSKTAMLYAGEYIRRCKRVLRHFGLDVGIPDVRVEDPLRTLEKLALQWKLRVEEGRLEDIRLLVRWIRAVEILGKSSAFSRNLKLCTASYLLEVLPASSNLRGEALLDRSAEIIDTIELENRR